MSHLAALIVEMRTILSEGEKKPKLGTGKRFAKLVNALKKRKGVKDPEALAAWIGRKKLGSANFAKMAAAGRHRAA